MKNGGECWSIVLYDHNMLCTTKFFILHFTFFILRSVHFNRSTIAELVDLLGDFGGLAFVTAEELELAGALLAVPDDVFVPHRHRDANLADVGGNVMSHKLLVARSEERRVGKEC